MSGMVYLLDTNVISELMRPEPSPAVLAWIDGAGVEGLALSAVSRWEIRYGLALLPEGKRRDDLALRFDGLVADLIGAGVYDLTSGAAERCASIMARQREMGESLDDHLPDAMIAGIAAQAGLTVATRNRSVNEGDVALTPLPQADGRVKNRPPIAQRRMPGFGDWLVRGVSTQLQQEIAGFDDPILADHADYATSGLKSPSLILSGCLAVLPESRLLGVIGIFAPDRHRRLLDRLSAYLVR